MLGVIIVLIAFFICNAGAMPCITYSGPLLGDKCLQSTDSSGEKCAYIINVNGESPGVCKPDSEAKGLCEQYDYYKCTYQAAAASLNSTLLTLTLTTGASYSPSTAVSWADDRCATHSEWLCAEFVAHSLHAAGMFPGVEDYGNYNGYNLKWVPDLHKALTHYGWSKSSTGQWCGDAGDVLIYIENGEEAHAALSIGNCLLDQHNPSRCGTSSKWGTNFVMKPK